MTEAVLPAPDSRLGNTEWTDNWTLGTGLRFELIEMATQRVYICQGEVSTDELAAFEPPEGFGHALAGQARADMAFFARSPGCDADGPVETAELGGRCFSYIARPNGFESLASGAVEMTIDKHHAMAYRAGRIIEVLDFGDGTVATPAWGSRDPQVVLTDSQLEDGWCLRSVHLVHDLLTFIPNPAQVFVLDRAFGFHGPLSEDTVSAVAQEIAR